MGKNGDSRNLRRNHLSREIGKRRVVRALKLAWRMVMAGTVAPRHRASTERTTVAAGERPGRKMTVIVPVSEAELDWLIAKKYLAEKERENGAAIKQAIESHLSAATKAAAG
jgi:hypothetical protein